MKKNMIALLAAGLLCALMLGIGCGKAAVEGNIAKKKTEAEIQTEEKDSERETKDSGRETEEGKPDAAEKMADATGGAEKTESLEEKEQAMTAQGGTEETERQKALREQLGIPERDQAEFVDGQGVTHRIDACVTVPDTDGFVTVSAAPQIFGDEEVEAYIKPLLGAGGLYRWEPEEYDNAVEAAASIDFRLRHGEYGDGERSRREEDLQAAKEKQERLAEDARKVEVPLSMTLEEKVDSGVYSKILHGLTDWDQRTAHLVAAKYGFTLSPWLWIVEHSCTISEELARALADTYVEKMGLSDELVLERMEPPVISYGEEECDYGAAYVFYYTRTVHGVPVGYQEAGLGGQGLKIMVDDNGLLEMGYSDYVVGDDEAPAELLPFSEIQKVYKEEWTCSYPECSLVSVDEIRLCYYWDEEGTERMVPAWELIGTCEYDSVVKEGISAGQERRRCLLLINAVDGTILSCF